jgi:hypothetical protein
MRENRNRSTELLLGLMKRNSQRLNAQYMVVGLSPRSCPMSAIYTLVMQVVIHQTSKLQISALNLAAWDPGKSGLNYLQAQ